MKQLLIVFIAVVALSSTGCVIVDCGTTHQIEGVLVDGGGKPISGWVGATERDAKPEKMYGLISDREKWGDPDKSWLGLTHTAEDGRFNLDKTSGITWGFTLLFGFIPLSSTTPPDVPVLDHVFLHVYVNDGWHTVRVSLTPEQQSRHKPGERWIDVGRITIE